MEYVVLYASTQNEAKIVFNSMEEFRHYTPVKAEFSGTKHGVKVYTVSYRKKKKLASANYQEFIRKDKINRLINKINWAKFNNNGIVNESFTAKLMNERMSDEQLNEPLWNNLSNNKESGKLFEPLLTDPTLPIVFVNTKFLIAHRYNKLGGLGKSVQNIKNILAKGQLNDVPVYDLKDGKVGEGNHRIQALYEMGYKTVPVRIVGGWD